jgi:hypothetical protein
VRDALGEEARRRAQAVAALAEPSYVITRRGVPAQALAKVLQSAGWPVLLPRLTQFMRCAEEPCVHFSGASSAPAFVALEVVADDLGGAQDVGDVRLRELAGARDEVQPDPGVAVGLELDTHRAVVRAPGVVRVRLGDAMVEAEQLLDVVADLVGGHVARREPAAEAERAPRVR